MANSFRDKEFSSRRCERRRTILSDGRILSDKIVNLLHVYFDFVHCGGFRVAVAYNRESERVVTMMIAFK